jgi:ribonucleoside-triphosphate reductase (thioredoxin)
MHLLTDEFLAQYPDAPEHMTELGAFVYYRTYSRWLPEEKRRETWKETVARSVDYNASLGLKQMEKNKYDAPLDKMKLEAETLFDNIFNLRQFLSGRTHWVGGAEGGVAEKFPLANFNCSFVNIRSWDDMGDLFYLLLVGTGVGFKCTKAFAEELAPIRSDIGLIHSEYKPLPKASRLEDTELHIMENGYAKMYVGDSKEGWVNALRTFFAIHTSDEYKGIHTLKISYNSVRPKGERLVTFGGTASGHEPLQEMFDGISRVIHNEIDPTLEAPRTAFADNYVHLRPIHVLDIGNLIGNNVVVGGVRRTAEIFLCDADDYEVILAKYGINGIWDTWKDGYVTESAGVKHQKIMLKLAEAGIPTPMWMVELKLNDKNARPLHHRRMSNNSIAFEEKPSKEILDVIFAIMQTEGEPGFVNMAEAKRRRPNAEGLNPCAEILLDSYGVCNLTTVNVDAFVMGEESGAYELDYSGLMQAQALSARAGMRMTCVDLELEHWDAVQKRDRLIGTSLTGWKDAMAKLEYDEVQEQQLLNLLSEVSHTETLKYARILRIPTPLLDTTVKPEGTLSQVAGGVSSGLHYSHAPYYIRRIRINANDPLAKVAVELGWTVNPEVGQSIENARTLVIDFPVASGATKTKDDVYVKEQFDTYFQFQAHYTSHNSSNTIHLRDDEWSKASDIIFDKWDDFVGVSFLSYDGGSYQLAPYETITEEEYHELKAKMKPFDAELLRQLEAEEFDKELAMEGAESCEGGACPIF